MMKMTAWYKTDINRLTYRELWHLSRRSLHPFAQAVRRKWFNAQWPVNFGLPDPGTLHRIDLQSIPDRPRDLLAAIISQVERHRFRLAFCHHRINLGDSRGYSAVLISADGMTLGNAVWAKSCGAEEAVFALGSRLDGRRLLTSSEPQRIDSPPEFDEWHLPGKSIDELVAIHNQRLDRLGRQRVLPAVESEIEARIIENQQLTHAFQLARGFYVPMTEEEIERLSGPVVAEVVAESANPYRAPREDEAAAQAGLRRPNSNRALGMSIGAGFVGGAIFGGVLGALSLRDALDQGIPLWALVVGYLIVTPLFAGGAGAVVGLACWAGKQVFRRMIP